MRNIIKDFLSDRTFQVKVGDILLEVKHVLSGIIQGSVIGPRLFLIFIDDLPGLLTCFNKLFADDLKMVVNPNNPLCTQADLKVLEQWEDTWSLYFNLEKCKVIHMLQSDDAHVDYKLANNSLQAVTKEKDLGVVLNNNFNYILKTA